MLKRKKIFKGKDIEAPRRRVVQPSAEAKKPSSVAFKRNRTLIGSGSNLLKTPEFNSSDFESPRAQIHHLNRQRRRILAILSTIALSTVGLLLILSNFTATVTVGSGDVALSKSLDESLYEKSIQDYLNNNPISRFIFVLNQSALTDYVSSKLPEVVSVSRKGLSNFGNTTFILELRKPIAGWQINDKQYYVDSKGIPFERNYFSNPDVQIVDNSGVSVQKAGTAIASKRFLSFVGRVVSLSKSGGYTVTQAIIPADTTRQLQVKLKEVDCSIKLSIDRPAGEQVEDMTRAVKYFSDRGRALTYIDVRVSGKAFYK